jgi:hypothetical protein
MPISNKRLSATGAAKYYKELIVLSIKLSNEMLLLLSNYSLAYLKPNNSNFSSKPGGG